MVGFAYDVQVNFMDGMLKSYLIPQFPEWYEDDEVEKFVCLPIVLVSDKLFTYIQDEYGQLPKEILNAVFSKASKKVDGLVQPIKYAFIVTDGLRMLVVDTDDEEVPNFKSHLNPKNADSVMDMLPKLKPIKCEGFSITAAPELGKTEQFIAQMLLPESKYMVGLSRAEKDMKSILMTYLYMLLTSVKKEEVRYWYSELFVGTFNDAKVKRMKKETMVKKMFEELIEGWDERHIHMGDEFIKFHDIFRESWKECKKRQTKKKSA